MIRTGFVLSTTTGWTGGANYIRNLLTAVAKFPNRRIEPVLIVPPEDEEKTRADFADFEILVTGLVRSNTARRAVRRLIERTTGRDILMERFLRRNRIDVLSHSGYLGQRARIPVVVWLADLQHVRMPEFFTQAEIRVRDREFRRNGRMAKLVIVSSDDARADLVQFMPDIEQRIRVLRFVSGIQHLATVVKKDLTRDKYGLDVPYFYLPNQFWQHKNHRLVLDALAIMKNEGGAPLVISTGSTEDYRAKGHFEALIGHREAIGVTEHFRVLGLVPFQDLGQLMRQSIAVINPSLFEGWSTTVEEAKTLGKLVILSDISVHREQNPDRALFVDPASPVSMANAMREAMMRWSHKADDDALSSARLNFEGRAREFVESYQAIIEEAVLGPTK